ncbi:RecQ-mediated genome instability protein 2 [Acipenser ruthenus]|uniref:RecQ-mediated genome instability protein 2 n=1 Tax=Acipenser ruthenus TaxID=7906 RepID=A0A444TYH9_ACIRT|nr:recQ-mediated genome instability protein 2 [Acipenser ruthenus]RXM27993.1 RecQ-mediated genome instability protein 2 [Acipenser ruthenus]
MNASRSPAAPGGALFTNPPVKVLASQLRESQVCLGPRGKNVYSVKRQGSASPGPPLAVSVVWMQGTVLEVTGDQNTTVQLLDETGTFIVTGASSVPRGRPCLHRGKYVMVMGSVQSCTPEPVVRAVKMADLSENPFHQSGWRLEVEDLQQTLP